MPSTNTTCSCPSCNCNHSRVYKTRHKEYTWKGKTTTRTVRERICRACGRIFKTIEYAVEQQEDRPDDKDPYEV